MPKTGLDSSEWIRRLRLFGKGEYVFGRGNEPPLNSKWAKKRALKGLSRHLWKQDTV